MNINDRMHYRKYVGLLHNVVHNNIIVVLFQ